MQLRKISDNCVEVIGNDGNVSMLFSYSTLVGVHISGQGYFTSNVRYSSTSKHVNAWLGGVKSVKMDQGALEQILLSPFGGFYQSTRPL
jgi:hypothetical protein